MTSFARRGRASKAISGISNSMLSSWNTLTIMPSVRAERKGTNSNTRYLLNSSQSPWTLCNTREMIPRRREWDSGNKLQIRRLWAKSGTYSAGTWQARRPRIASPRKFGCARLTDPRSLGWMWTMATAMAMAMATISTKRSVSLIRAAEVLPFPQVPSVRLRLLRNGHSSRREGLNLATHQHSNNSFTENQAQPVLCQLHTTRRCFLRLPCVENQVPIRIVMAETTKSTVGTRTSTTSVVARRHPIWPRNMP
mmetsp:Transcript_17667/g.50032  ORF Transcript_17667/g.50032 Transcript_17667/m.50032 type:complete len:252 (+) Transcript_17667:417-1172(+)